MDYKETMKSKNAIANNYNNLISIYGYQDIEIKIESYFSDEQEEIIFKGMETHFWDEDYEYELRVKYENEYLTFENHLVVFEGIMKLLANRESLKSANIKTVIPACFEDKEFIVVRINQFLSNENSINLLINRDEKEYDIWFFRGNRTEDHTVSYYEEDPLEFTDNVIKEVENEIEKILKRHDNITESIIDVREDLQSVKIEFCCNYVKYKFSVLSYGNNLADEEAQQMFFDALCCFLAYAEDREENYRQSLKNNYFHIHTKTMSGDLILAYRQCEKYEIRIHEEKMPEYEEMQKRKAIQKYMVDFDNMDGHTFEHYCAKILSLNAFENVHVTQGSGDQGIDIIAYKDGVKYGIQCKCYSSNIGNKAVQEAFAGKAFYDCHVGIVLTNQYFTDAAIELARKNGIILWNRNKLLQMIENCNV